jgi:hypothetical protein
MGGGTLIVCHYNNVMNREVQCQRQGKTKEFVYEPFGAQDDFKTGDGDDVNKAECT